MIRIRKSPRFTPCPKLNVMNMTQGSILVGGSLDYFWGDIAPVCKRILHNSRKNDGRGHRELAISIFFSCMVEGMVWQFMTAIYQR